VLREAVKISPKKLLAEQDLINSNKLLDESQDIAKVGVGNDVITKDLIWSKGIIKLSSLKNYLQ
jgi:hypothetical protein